MRRVHGFAIAFVAVLVLTPATPASAQDESRAVTGGGISIPGWTGRIDAAEVRAGQVLENARLAADGNGMHVRTGPAVTYWNPANTATGSYTVSATFREPEYMALNSHPHPYGIVVAGNGMGSDQQSYLYCAAYGNGRFIVRGFGPEPFQLNGRGEEHAAVNRAAGPGEPVTQQIAVSVHPDRIECAINGSVVGTYPRADVVAAGRLGSTDGVYGVRFGHNTEAFITEFGVRRH
jgi:hypothetical protein